MKRNLNVTLKNLDKTPITEALVDQLAEGKEVVRKLTELTLATVCVNALLMLHQDERELAGTEKVKRYKLAQKITDHIDSKTSVVVTAEDVTLLKSLIGKAYSALVVGQAFDLLEVDPEVPKVKDE